MLRQARELVNTIKVEDLALLSPKEVTEYQRRGKGKQYNRPSKKKGGHVPIDYTAVEILADLKLEVERDWPNLAEVTKMYLQLRRIIDG